MPRHSLRYQNLEDLHLERERVSWYWRLIALVSSWMILGGYLILPAAFTIDPQLRFSKGVLSILIVTIMTTGYSFTALLCFAVRNWIFQAESVFLPALTSSALGLLTVLWCFVSSKRFEWNTAAIVTTALASFSSLLYGLLLIYTHRKITKFREMVIANYQRPVTGNDPYYKNYLANMYPSAVNPTESPQPTEDEEVSRQMATLLMRRNDSGLSPEAWQSTFRLSLPEEDMSQEPLGREITIPGGIRYQHLRNQSIRQVHRPQRQKSTWDRLTRALTGGRSGSSNELSPEDRGRDHRRNDSNTSRAVSREERRREIELRGISRSS